MPAIGTVSLKVIGLAVGLLGMATLVVFLGLTAVFRPREYLRMTGWLDPPWSRMRLITESDVRVVGLLFTAGAVLGIILGVKALIELLRTNP